MNSRERVRKALNHENPDRPPFDITYTIYAYNNLIKHLGLNLKPKTECSLFMTVKVDLELIEKMKMDFAYVGLAPSRRYEPFRYGAALYRDLWGLQYKKVATPNGEFNYQVVNTPLKDFTGDDLDSYEWPDAGDESIFENLLQEAEFLHHNTDLAVVGNFGGSIFTLASLLRGMEQWYMDLMLDQEFAQKLLEKLSAYYSAIYKKALQLCGKYLDIVRIDNDDYGTQNGLLISKELFVKLIKPIVSEYYREVKNEFLTFNPDGKLMKHSCGDVSEIIGDFIDMGIDILDPVQVSARGMDISRLKETFGQSISFHGAIDTQHILPYGKYEDVKAEVKRTAGILGGSGGYIVAPVHHVEGDVPPENLIAIRDALLDF